MVDENPLPHKKAVVIGFTSILLIITGIICAVYGVNYHKDVYSSTDHVLYKTFSKKVNIHTNETITSKLTYTAKAPKILWLCFLVSVSYIADIIWVKGYLTEKGDDAWTSKNTTETLECVPKVKTQFSNYHLS